MRKLTTHSFAALLLVVGAGSARAAEIHVDVNVYQQGGVLVIGGMDFDALQFVDQIIFEGELEDPDEDGQFTGDEPGWNSFSDASAGNLPVGADNLPGNTDVTLDIVLGHQGRSLSYWDGTGPVTFGATIGSEVLKVEDANASVSVIDGSAAATGIDLGTTSGTGLLHEHYDFGLFGDASVTPDFVNEGIYLVEGQISAAGFGAPSDSFFILFGTFTELNEEDLEEAIELAEGWVERNKVPEPGSVVLLFSGLVGTLALGRRRP